MTSRLLLDTSDLSQDDVAKMLAAYRVTPMERRTQFAEAVLDLASDWRLDAHERKAKKPAPKLSQFKHLRLVVDNAGGAR